METRGVSNELDMLYACELPQTSSILALSSEDEKTIKQSILRVVIDVAKHCLENHKFNRQANGWQQTFNAADHLNDIPMAVTSSSALLFLQRRQNETFVMLAQDPKNGNVSVLMSTTSDDYWRSIAVTSNDCLLLTTSHDLECYRYKDLHNLSDKASKPTLLWRQQINEWQPNQDINRWKVTCNTDFIVVAHQDFADDPSETPHFFFFSHSGQRLNVYYTDENPRQLTSCCIASDSKLLIITGGDLLRQLAIRSCRNGHTHVLPKRLFAFRLNLTLAPSCWTWQQQQRHTRTTLLFSATLRWHLSSNMVKHKA